MSKNSKNVSTISEFLNLIQVRSVIHAKFYYTIWF